MTAITQTTSSVNMHYAKTHLSRLIEEVVATGKPVTIAKSGVPKVKIVPINNAPNKRQMGTLKDKIRIPDNFDSAFSDEIEKLFWEA